MIVTQVKAVSDGEYQIVKTNTTDGKVKDTVVIKAAMAVEEKELGQRLTKSVREDGTLRAVYQTLLGKILQNTRLDGFRGTGDKATGKTSKEFKAAVRDAETATIEELVKQGYVKLEKADSAQLALQTYLGVLRDNKNYSNIKSYCSQYYAICGHLPVTPSGRLVPQPVMVEEIKALVNKQPSDSSVFAKLDAVLVAMKKKTLDSDEAIKGLSKARELVSLLSDIVDDYAEKATTVRGNVADTTKEVLAQMAKDVEYS